MGAPGLEAAGDVGKVPKPLQHLPAGAGVARPGRSLRHHRDLFAVARVAAEVRFDRALVLFQVAVHHRMVDAVDAVYAHLLAEGLVRGIVFGHHQQAAGVFVDAVHDARADGAANAGELPGTVVEQRVDQRAVGVAGRRVHHHAFGFVDDEQVGVLIHDVQRDILRRRLDGLRVRHFHRHPVPCPRLVAFGHAAAVDLYARFLNKVLQGAAGQPFARLAQKAVQALAGSLRRHGAFKRLHRARRLPVRGCPPPSAGSRLCGGGARPAGYPQTAARCRTSRRCRQN